MAKLTGTDPNQVPTNADLGTMAYQDKDNASISKIQVENDGDLELNPDGGKITVGANNFDANSGDLQGITTLYGRATGSTKTFGKLTFQNSNDSGGSYTQIQGKRIDSNYGAELWFYTNPWDVAQSPKHVMALKSKGDVSIIDGNLVLANGHGIDFSAQTGTSASGASTNVEVLDHYETGSWTPTFSAADMVPGTGAGETNITYFSRSGRYTRIGDTVHITGNIITSGRSGTERAGLTVDGLPFTCGTPASHSMSVSFAYNFTDNATAPLAATVQGTTSHILLYTNQTSNVQCDTSDINASGSSYFNFAGTYLVG